MLDIRMKLNNTICELYELGPCKLTTPIIQVLVSKRMVLQKFGNFTIIFALEEIYF